ncbi:MAG TPA: TonB-dependent receptor [Bacteroidia bacterium]|nr:TonB-dependent receptor [Bacteroidia bacterium]HNT79765.1 TonB-dependent receptor [Bacteroidia bacterium]
MQKLFPILTTIFLLSFLLISNQSYAQKKYTVSGYVKDASSGESLFGANVYIKELLKGNSTNAYGFYSITLNEGSYTLVTTYLGFKTFEKSIELKSDLRINIEMETTAITGEEVTIIGERPEEKLKSTQMSKDEMEVESIKTLPAFLGEVDVLKTIQLLPGVQSAGEGNTGFYVRGGGPDQNLILLDEAVVYNASHLFGFFSVFNSDAIKNISLTKGGIPANYGGRLSSVLDITMKDGNSKSYHGTGGIGLISSRFTFEGPIVKEKSSFIISGRRTFVDLFMRKPFIKESNNAFGSSYYFYDLNAKLNYSLSHKDRLFLSGYFGRDVFKYTNQSNGFKAEIPWGNSTISLRWNHIFNDNIFLNTTLIYSDYQFELGFSQTEFDLRFISGIRDYSVKTDFTYFPNIKHTMKFGLQYIYHKFTPSTAEASSGDVDFDTGKTINQFAHETAVYVNDEYEINDKIKLSGGLRMSSFIQVGPFERFLRNDQNLITDTIVYSKGETVSDYFNVEPRIAASYSINTESSVKASFTRAFQYAHLASFSSISLPTDVWIPSSSIVKPQIGNQYAAGYFRDFMDHVFETSLELYYKTLKNQIEYKDGALPEDNVNDNADNNLTFGKGWSYGAELFVKKKYGALNGWIGYTLAYTKRQFDEVNNAEEFFARYDRRHDLSLVMSYQKPKSRWTFGLTWVYASGNGITVPISRYFVGGELLYEYGKRNDYRMDAYHRLDFSATIDSKNKDVRKFKSSWTFAVFNVYSRKNPYFIYFDDEGNLADGTLQLKAKQVSLFPILPSVTYNFKF